VAISQQLVPVTLRGLSEKSPSNLSAAGELTSAVNVQVLKGGPAGVELTKRYGTQPLSTATDSIDVSTAAPNHLSTLGGQLVMDNSQAILVYDNPQQRWIARDHGGFTWGSFTEVLSQSLYQKTSPCHAIDPTTGVEIIAWYDQADGIRFTTRDRATGTIGTHERTVGSAPWNANYKVQVFAPGDGYFYLFGPQIGTLQLNVWRVNRLDPRGTITSYVIGGTDAVTTAFDVQALPEGTFLFAVKSSASTATETGIWSPGVLGVTIITPQATNALNVCMWLSQSAFGGAGARFYYLVTSDTFATGTPLATNLYTIDPTMTVTATASLGTSSGNIVGYYDPILLSAQVWVDALVGPGLDSMLSLTGGATIRSVSSASRAFFWNGNWFAIARYDSVIQPTLFLILLAAAQPVGKVDIAQPQWSNLYGTFGKIPWVTVQPAPNASRFIAAVGAGHTALGQTFNSPIGTTIQGVDLVEFDAAPSLGPPVELGGVLHYPGSIPYLFDGANTVEVGFNVFPENTTMGDNGSGTSKTVGASYAYRATYVWRDATGNVYESAPSPTLSYVATTVHDILVTIPSYRLTIRTDVAINVYRDDPTQPSVFRLVNAAILPNNLYANTVTLVDNLADLVVGNDWPTRPLLYNGDGGASGDQVEIEHIPPPSCTIAATAQGRVFLAGIDQDPSAVWVSNAYNPTYGLSYSDAITLRIIGNITAIAGRDRNLVIFTETTIWTVTGEFPDATGGSYQVPTAFKLPHPVGAINPNSLVTTSIGIFFQSDKGIHLLDWGWGVTYIGADVEDTLATATITGGLEAPELHQVRLYTSGGDTLAWDTVFNLWTSFDTQPALAAVNWSGVPCWADVNGAVWVETPGAYGDNGAWVQSTVGLAIIAPAGLRGYFCLFELQLLGQVLGAHHLNATLAYNSQNFITTQYGFDNTGQILWGAGNWGDGSWGGATDNVLKVEIRPKKRQAGSYQLTVWDSSLSSGPSAGFTLQAVVASIGVEGGLTRVGNTGRMSKV
jgi:hypothetical protein